MVGVEAITIFLFQNVVVLFKANETGSPSAPALKGKRSISSANRILTGLLANPLALFAPTTAIKPPSNFLCKTVFSLSFALGSFTLPFKTLLLLSIGFNLSLLHVLAISKVGCMTRTGQGSCEM